MAATLESISKYLNELERRYTELDHLMAIPRGDEPRQLMGSARSASDLEESLRWRELRDAQTQIDELA